jgi:hypothetical protein
LPDFSPINNPRTPDSLKQHPFDVAADLFFVVTDTVQNPVFTKIVCAWKSSTADDGVA